METSNQALASKNTGLDVAIKVLTIIKLLLGLAFWGLMVGLTIYFLLHNPIPKLLTYLQQQLLQNVGNVGSLLK